MSFWEILLLIVVFRLAEIVIEAVIETFFGK